MAGDHACPDCGATFTRPQHVTRHARIHTGERPYACPTCPEAFPRSDLLSRHISRTHLPGAAQYGKKRKRPLGAAGEDQVRRACGPCVKARARCDGRRQEEDACRRCKMKGIACSYPEASSNTAGPSQTPAPPPAFVSSSSPLPYRNTNSYDESTLLPPSDLQGSPSSSSASWDSLSNASSSGNLSFLTEGLPPLPSFTTNEFLHASYQEKQLPSMEPSGLGSPSPLLPTRTPSGLEFLASSITYPLASQPPPPISSSSYPLQPSSIGTDFGYLPVVVDSPWGEMSGSEGLEEFGTALVEALSKRRVDGISFGLVGMPPSPPESSGHTISTRTSNESFSTSFSAPSSSLSTSLRDSHPSTSTQSDLHASYSQLTFHSKPRLEPSSLFSSPLPSSNQELVDYQRKQKQRQEQELESFFNTCFHPPTSLAQPQTSSYLSSSPLPPLQPLFERRKASPRCSSSNTTAGESSAFGDQVGLLVADEGSFPLHLGGGLVERRSPDWWEAGRMESGMGGGSLRG